MQSAHIFHLQRMGDGGIGIDGAVTAAILKLGSIGLFERTVVQIYILDQAVRASFKAGQLRAARMDIAEVQIVDAPVMAM